MFKVPFLISMLILSLTASIYSQASSEDKTVVRAARNFESDGCTMWFNGQYRSCCEAHDKAYLKKPGWRARLQADNRLFTCIARMGFAYSFVAPVMWLGVRIFGSPLFPISWKRKTK